MASIFVSVSGFSCAHTLLWRGSEKKKSLHSTSFLFSGMCWASWWVFDVFHFNTDSDSSPGWDSLPFLLFISCTLSLCMSASLSIHLSLPQRPTKSFWVPIKTQSCCSLYDNNTKLWQHATCQREHQHPPSVPGQIVFIIHKLHNTTHTHSLNHIYVCMYVLHIYPCRCAQIKLQANLT